MNEFEEKMWVTSRIELITKITIEEWRVLENTLQQMRIEEKEKINDHRNIVLSILGISLSMILALNTDHDMNKSLFFGLLIVIAVIGFLTLALSTIYRSHISNSFIHVENQVVDAINHMSHLIGFINVKTVELNQSDIGFLKNFLHFGYYVGVAQLILIKISLDAGSKNRFLTKFAKNTLHTNSKSLNDEINKIVLIIAEYVPDKDIPKEWYEDSQEIVESYKKTITSDDKTQSA